MSDSRRRFCQRRLVVLPYNWGDNFPDTVTLDDGRRRSPRGRRGRMATQVESGRKN